ncbi:hypothetical protein LNQ81_13165 [Myroides sp. M-43]|uniref:hypothetical protein n=1 Tax=Myroides oncorhynchi TaxID=2893756 RepID=UPI001E5FDFDE|nr:hypothetical protein [Myroides oncorhynchi]MCC9043624.1 hypothetical protein [Myroides oncorhynchi]
MSKYKCLMFVCVFVIVSYGQVGVNLPIPLVSFHVDGSGNTPSNKTPSVEETKDDFVVTKEGRVGIGTINPLSALDINGKIKIVDGNQANNKILKSDDNGNMKWESISYITSTITGSFENTNQVAFKGTEAAKTYTHSRGVITLTKGRWIVNCGLTLDVASNRWLHAVLSTSKTVREQNGFSFLGPAGNNTSYASRVFGGGDYSLVFGSSFINVTADSVTLYLLIENLSNWSFSPTSWENYFYAIPVL